MEKIKKFLHDYLKWGFDAGLKEKDALRFQNVHKCRYCDKEIAQDSTGSWFHFTD